MKFTSVLPPINGETDLWVVRLAPCHSDPEGAFYTVRRQYLTRYPHAIEMGYDWTWAPLKEVVAGTDPNATPVTPESETGESKYELLKLDLREDLREIEIATQQLRDRVERVD